MRVTIVSSTPNALDLLLRTKNTRLRNDEDISQWSQQKKLDELAYMKDTIKSSWAFVDYVFHLEDVSRIFTHQLVRSDGRTTDGDFAQESQRTVPVSDQKQSIPMVAPNYEMNDDQREMWNAAINDASWCYEELIKSGMPTQEARRITPEGKSTSIFAKFDLRAMHYMGLERLCARTQGEYQEVYREMRSAVLELHPYFEEFLQVYCVTTGTCMFPRWGKDNCQIYDPRMDLTQLKADTKKKFWESPIQVAVPVANKGRTS